MRNKIVVIIILVLAAGNIFFASQWYGLNQVAVAPKVAPINTKVLDFTALFIKDVLRAKGEISFDTRLELENAVRSLNSPEILQGWQNFTASKTEADAQDQVKSFLELLVRKVRG